MRELNWSKVGGLMPAIVQHANTGEVLMLGYMNQDAYAATHARQRVTFYSRSKQRLWTKGEDSGHFLALVSIGVDCDGDSLLVLAIPNGPTCHEGTSSCFIQSKQYSFSILPQLEARIEGRIKSNDSESYCVKIAKQGIQRSAQKVGEEGVEVALAAVTNDKEEVINESTDLLFHLMLLWQLRGVQWVEVLAETAKRFSLWPTKEA